MLTHLYIELLMLVRQPWQVVSVMASALTMLMLLRFGIPASMSEAVLLPAFVLGVSIITLISTTAHAFSEDARAGRIAHWLVGRLSVEWVVVSRFLAYLLAIGLPMVVLFVAVMHFRHDDTSGLTSGYAIAVLLMVMASTIACGLLGGALSVCFHGGGMLATLTTLPFLFSVLIFAAPLLGAYTEATMFLLLATTLFLVPLCCFATARVLRVCV
jgi:heme exporter protein CcmB